MFKKWLGGILEGLGYVWELIGMCFGQVWELFWTFLGQVLEMFGRFWRWFGTSLKDVWEVLGGVKERCLRDFGCCMEGFSRCLGGV